MSSSLKCRSQVWTSGNVKEVRGSSKVKGKPRISARVEDPNMSFSKKTLDIVQCTGIERILPWQGQSSKCALLRNKSRRNMDILRFPLVEKKLPWERQSRGVWQSGKPRVCLCPKQHYTSCKVLERTRCPCNTESPNPSEGCRLKVQRGPQYQAYLHYEPNY